MARKKPYNLTLTFVQSTDGDVDGRTLVEEFTADPTVHAIKTQVFTEELTEAIGRAVKKLTDMAIEVNTANVRKK